MVRVSSCTFRGLRILVHNEGPCAVSSPHLTLPTPALPGERALTESLATLPDRQARWERMYVNNDQTRDALMSDPDDLGSDYSIRHFFGSEADWAGIATWSEGVQSGLSARAPHA